MSGDMREIRHGDPVVDGIYLAYVRVGSGWTCHVLVWRYPGAWFYPGQGLIDQASVLGWIGPFPQWREVAPIDGSLEYGE